MNKYINITKENLESEHLCCAIGDKKHEDGVKIKKEWLKNKINDGHVFRKLDAQGKIFIEYEPLDTAWVPVSGEKFIYIYCLWVAGSFKEKGYAKELIEYAINDAKEKKMEGICVITSKKKKPFLSDKKFFEKYGFKVVDEIEEYELLSLSFNNKNPKFNSSVKEMKIKEKDFTIYYSPECPYTNNCIKQLKEYSKEKNVKINFIKIDTLEKAKNVPCIFNNWATFKDGKFVSNTLLNKNSLDKLLK